MASTEVTNFRLAGFLAARGHQLERTYRNVRRELVFVFGASALGALDAYPGSAEERYDAACKALHALTTVRASPEARDG